MALILHPKHSTLPFRLSSKTNPTLPDLMNEATLQLTPAGTIAPKPECFIGEMLHIGSSRHYPTEMLAIGTDDVVSRVGFTFPVSVDDDSGVFGDGESHATDDEGGCLPARYLKRACTILILHAVRHDMPEWGEGFEVRDVGLVKILPFPLKFLLDLDDRLDTFQSLIGRRRLCLGCDKRQYPMHRCPRCKMFYFCNRECQEAAKKTGHAIDCSILCDPDVEALFLGWTNELENFASVSLKTH
ncbi:uncharacterized protein BDV14DRAFT_199275 [Aspergillus stella-maris]|uniref:uncharacterized protein n=1 Tax=Aspergillus stella-maris TaxID=1810926 RepID=UPI003CCDD6D2